MEGSVELLWQGRSVTLRRGPREHPLAALRRCIPARRSWCPASPGTTRGRPSPACPGGIRALRLRGPGGRGHRRRPRPGGPHRRPGLQRGGGCVLLPGRAPPAGLAQPPEAQQDRPDPRLEEELADVERPWPASPRPSVWPRRPGGSWSGSRPSTDFWSPSGTPTSSRAMAQRRARWEAAQAALAEAQAQVDGLEAERTRHGAPPDRDTLKGPRRSSTPSIPSTPTASWRRASWRRPGRRRRRPGPPQRIPCSPA